MKGVPVYRLDYQYNEIDAAHEGNKKTYQNDRFLLKMRQA